jgi:aminoglycoside phosphotransferase (APT) family kinase protein
MELDGGVVQWIEDVTRGSVVRVEHQGRWRPHFFVDVQDYSGAIVPLLVRMVRDQEFVALSAFLSHFDLAHEARTLAALQGETVKAPRTYGFHEDPAAILMERVEGSNELGDIDPSQRSYVMRQYIENLHHLHTIAVDTDLATRLARPLPTSPAEVAFGQLSYVEADFQQAAPFIRPEPLLTFALWWLKSNVPQHRLQPSWVQGDTGPGQFMVHDGELTALIDWELSHLGDPLLDLGVMRMRNMLYPIGSLRESLDYYAELAGEPLDRDVLCFYTVMSTLVSPLGMAAVIQQPSTAMKAMMPMLGWDVTLRRGLCDALAEAYGVEVTLPELPETPEARRTDLNGYLIEHLTTQCLPLGRNDYDALLLDGALGLAKTNARIAAVGESLDNDDLDDMQQVLNHRPAEREAGLTEITAIVADYPEDRSLDLIWLFTRMEMRREHLWRPLMIAQESQPLERLYPATRTLTGPRGHRLSHS